MTAAQQWREQLASWAIPAHILDAVDESPWELPVQALVRRVEARVAEPRGVSLTRTVEALGRSGSVLDVGAGAGAASLPLADRIAYLVAVDTNADALDALSARARDWHLPVRTVVGRWPDVEAEVSTVDVVVCHHVFYNVPELAEFATALHEHARRRVVVELTERHPLAVHTPYWRRLHGLDRPEGPTAADAIAVLREAGLSPRVERWQRPPTPRGDFDELVELTRRAVCLPVERRDELLAVMRELGVEPARDLMTLWWDTEP